MSKGALFRGPPVARGALAASLAVCMLAGASSLRAQDFRSLQDMLLVAIRLNDVAAVRSSVASGADVAKRAYNGKTAIDVAVDLGRFDIAEILVAERRRQREAKLAAPLPVATRTAEIIQPSAEAPPELASAPPPPVAVPQPPPSLPVAAPVPLLPPIASVTPEQLLAMAQQLAAAAQALASAQTLAGAQPRRAAPRPEPAPVVAAPPAAVPAEPPPDKAIGKTVEVAALPAVEPFAPRPGHKPEVPQRAAAAEPDAALAPAPVPDTVVVTPRRRTNERNAADLIDAPESEPASVAPRPVAKVSPSVPRDHAPVVQPAATPPVDDERAEPDGNDLMKTIKGIGGFFGIGPEPTRTETPPPSVRELREHSREPPRRKNVPHVPARRASEFRTELPPGSSPAVAPTPAGAKRVAAPRSANPFDPGAPPQDGLLPLTDPVAGDAPEIAPPPAEPMVQETPLAPPARAAAARSAPRPRTAGIARAPEVPPLADAGAAASPTAAFERRPVSRAAPPPPKEEASLLRSLASAAGLAAEDAEEPTNEPGDPEKMLSRKMPLFSLRPPLADVPLALGTSVATGDRQLPRGIAEPDPCIRRSGGAVVFCVVPVDWPQGIDRAFSLTTYLYQGTRAIARYDGGRASHYHALFASHQFKDIVAWFTERYGPPTDEWKRSIAPFDQPRQPNPTYVWRSRDSRTQQVTILEVRQYDDTRNVFPDMDHGAVRLYKSGAQRVFPVITGIDIMGIDWAARSDHGDGSDPRALANTIRIGR